MFETIMVGALVILIIGAGVFSWWMDNGGSKSEEEESSSEEGVPEESTDSLHW